jgi:tetratricopeptide (TPR) repeat protein
VETADLLKALLHYLPFSGNMTQLIITCRYEFSLTEQNRDLVEERLEKVWLIGFQEPERRKKAQELKNILHYADQSLVPQLLSAGYGNPRLMEWVDVLVGQMKKAEVPQLVETIKNKQEDFIREHIIRELLKHGGKQLTLFSQCLSIYRRSVQIEGVQQVAEKAGIKDWEDLLKKGMGLSLIEHHQARQAYQLTPLLREELLSKLEDTQSCHQAAFAYYKTICEDQESIDPVLVEEWIFHALGGGEEKTASQQGSRLVKHLRERLAYRESRRVGLWITKEKKQKLSKDHDSFLLNELAFTLKSLGDYQGAIKYYKQALSIDRGIFGEADLNVARDLNNLGTTWRALAKPEKTIEYCEHALRILRTKDLESKHPNFAGTVLHNIGSAWEGKGEYEKAIEYYKQALVILKNFLGDNHPDVAITLNNLGSAWNNLGNHQKAAEYFKQALSIDLSVFGKVHPDVATDLNNLGAVCYDQGDYRKSIEYYEEALTIWRKIYQEKHQNIAATLYNLGEAYFALDQKEKAKKCFEEAYPILKELLGPKHPALEDVAAWLSKVKDKTK